jgi:hypothetical protein
MHAQNHLINFVEQVIDEVELGDGPLTVHSKLDNVKIRIFLHPHDLVGKIFDEITDMFGTDVVMTRGGRLLELHKSETVFAFGLCNEDWIVLAHRGRGGAPKKKQKVVANKSDLIDDLVLEIDNLARQVVVDNDPLVQEIIQHLAGVRQALRGREPADCFAAYARLLSDVDLERISSIGMGNGNPDYKVDAISKVFFHGVYKSIRKKRDRLCVLESMMTAIMKHILIEKFFCDGSYNWTGENESSFSKTMTRIIIDKAKAGANAMQD